MITTREKPVALIKCGGTDRGAATGIDTEACIKESLTDKVALRRMVAPQNAAAAFLASHAASGITGTHLKVDCGRAS